MMTHKGYKTILSSNEVGDILSSISMSNTSPHSPLVTPHTLEYAPYRSSNVGLGAANGAVGRAGVGVGADEDGNQETSPVVPASLSGNEPLRQLREAKRLISALEGVIEELQGSFIISHISGFNFYPHDSNNLIFILFT